MNSLHNKNFNFCPNTLFFYENNNKIEKPHFLILVHFVLVKVSLSKMTSVWGRVADPSVPWGIIVLKLYIKAFLKNV